MSVLADSYVHLCHNVGFDNTYQHTIKFADSSAQYAYFVAKSHTYVADMTYLRKNRSIKVALNIEDIKSVNYLVYNNKDKPIYNFVVEKRYISENCTELIIELDVMQTYQFNYLMKQCYVDREHVSNDTIGANIVDEQLELGEYIVNAKQGSTTLSELCVIICVSMVLFDDLENVNQYNDMYAVNTGNGIYNGLLYYAIRMEHANFLGILLTDIDVMGKGDGVVAVFMYPKEMLDVTWGGETKYLHKVENSSVKLINISKATSYVNGYTPKNKKLLAYPYNLLQVSNNQGGCATYKWENFNSVPASFSLYTHVSPDPTVKLVPYQYNGALNNYDEGLSLGGYPLCAYKYGVWQNWYASNKNSLNLQYLTGTVGVVAGAGTAAVGAFTGNLLAVAGGVGSAYGGASAIASTMAKINDMSIQPPQARGNTSSGSLNCANGIQDFTFYSMSIRYAQAQRIDNYFTMYGYKVNNLKVPATTSRKYWNYIKTIGCTIDGSIDFEDMQHIQNIYDKGITLWHYRTGDFSIGDYTKSNIIV